jgi:hypothetical protein
MKATVIHLRKEWYRLKPHLHDPKVELALEAGMNVWCRDYAYEPRGPFDPERGPWWYSRSDYWCGQKQPKKDTHGWYRCSHACHWIRGFACALGQAAYPHLDWCIVEGEKHSTAVGMDDRELLILDPLQWYYSTAQEIAQRAGMPDQCDYIDLDQEIVARQIEYRFSPPKEGWRPPTAAVVGPAADLVIAA